MAKWITVAGVACLWFFAAGLFIGRALPAHRFERLGNSPYLLDTSTGALCNAFPATTVKNPDGFDLANPNPIDQALTDGHHIAPCPTVK
jgi:hypothetical protein